MVVQEKMLKALQGIPENKLTTSIIIPLLVQLEYYKVEFYGGSNEEGKDILCWEKDKIGDIRLSVAQVKHYKPSNKASDKKSFQTIVNQLIMCFTKSIPFTDQTNHIPYEALLISTYPIDTKTLQTRFSEQQNLSDRKIKIIDGLKLISLLTEHAPHLLKEFVGESISLNFSNAKSLNNKILLKALGSQDNISLEQIYTEIDFSLGKYSTELFFELKLKGILLETMLNEQEWNEFMYSVNNSSSLFQSTYLLNSIESIEENYKTSWNNHYSKLNNIIIEIKDELLFLTIHQESDSKTIKSLIAEIKRIERKSSLNKFYINQRNELADEIRYILNNKLFLNYENDFIVSITNKLNKLIRKFKPGFKVIINGEDIVHQLLIYKNYIINKVSEFNLKNPNSRELSEFILLCKNIFDNSSFLINNKFIAQAINADKSIRIRNSFESTRFKLPINEVFDTEINITLLGEAGAGKTTNLQMYALNKIKLNDKFVIWLPLAFAVQNWSKSNQNVNQETKISNFILAILEYLISQGTTITKNELEYNLKNSKSILLLDGLDETIKNNPWLPKAIIRLADKYKPKLQIIVTSRISGTFIDELPFFTITLLPFTDNQRDEFIGKWFGQQNIETISKIKSHLSENKSINEITRNPLLTTILCVLAKHNLPLPQTEVKLYNDRIRLLTGYYDNVKNIVSRVLTTPQDLEQLSKKLAYYLHSNGIREAEYEVLQDKAAELMSKTLGPTESKVALNELISPCNILVTMTDEGGYGFGHLRFQEHLTALELLSNRNINLLLLLSLRWWKAPLTLFAQMSDNINWLILQMGHNVLNSEHSEILEIMISQRPESEKREIKKTINKLKRDFELFRMDII